MRAGTDASRGHHSVLKLLTGFALAAFNIVTLVVKMSIGKINDHGTRNAKRGRLSSGTELTGSQHSAGFETSLWTRQQDNLKFCYIA